MKFRGVALAISGSLLSIASAMAQQTAPTATEVAQQELKRATALLSLTTDQQTAALAIFVAEATSAATLQASTDALHKTLDTAITGGDTSAITTAAASIGTVDGQLTAVHAAAEAKLYLILTADQQTKFSALLDAQIGVGGPGGPGGGAGGPGGSGGSGGAGGGSGQ